MRWRPIGSHGEDYPEWLRDLRRKSGAYAIRRSGLIFTTIVYVGESHTGNLYKTITRHFQVWTRQKRPPQTVADWWAKARVYSAEQTDPGHTYDRGECEVAIEVCPASRAVALQDAWIRRLKPRDNQIGPGLEDAPF